MNEAASSNQNNTAIGIVIPTPTQQTNDSLSFTIPNRVSDTLSQSSISSQRSNNSNLVLPPRASVEEKLTQIQEYIKITTSLLNSMELEEPPNEGQERLIKSLENLKASEGKLQNILNTKYDDMLSTTSGMASIHEDENVITSRCLENVDDDEPQSMRAHSISSINTNASSAPTTPTYEELKIRLEHQTKNMQSIKDQQNQLICLQQLAKQQLAELQKVRVAQAADPNAANRVAGGPPSYDSVEQVQSDVSNLMNRMKTLTNFIQNQNDLSALLGDDGEEIMAEQLMLQTKLSELKSKKQHMENLVAELHTYSGECGDHSQLQQIEDEDEEEDREQTPTRSVPVEYHRIVPIELIGNHNGNTTASSNGNSNNNHNNQRALPPVRTPVTRDVPIQIEQDANIEPIHEGISKADQVVINDKIAEINAMKEQLRRLKQMMDTVKEIEMDAAEGGAGQSAGDDGDDEQEENNEQVHEIFVNKSVNRERGDPISVQAAPSPQVPKQSNTNEFFHQNSMQDTENIQNINQRVFELQSLTQDLRQQALSLAAQRDRLQIAKDEALKKELEKERKMQAAGIKYQPVIIPQQQSQKDLEKQREQEKILKAIEKEVELEDEKLRRQNGFLFFNENSSNSQLPTSNSSVHSNERSENLHYKKKNHVSSNEMGKLSADSGAADMFGVNGDARSIKSDSVRSINIGPTGLPERNPQSQQNHTTQNSNYCMSSRGYCSPWMMQHYPCNQFNECQSPGWHYPNAGFNHAGSGQDHTHHCQPNVSAFTNDSSIFQEFLQTQQLLVNTICKCNELLWSQQKEINNLNHAVVWLQEKFLAQNASLEVAQLPEIRAESVPPLTSVGMQMPPYFQRAQSEIPPPLRPIINNNLYQTSPMRTNRPPSNVQPNLFHNTNDLVNHQRQTTSSVYQNHFLLNSAQSTQQNGTMIHNQPLNNHNNHPMSSNHGDTTPIFMHHNNNINSNTSNHNNNINNKLFHGTGAANVNQSALNNKVPPGNRANNYWDNFRSYSRQNLLSSNSCKSNDGSYCMSTNQSNFQQQQQQQHNVNIDRLSLRNQQSINNYNNLANNYRNQINPINVSTRYHDAAVSINLNQPGETETMGNAPAPPDASINICSASENSAPNHDANYIQAASLLQFHTNPINLGVCDFNAKYKTPPKRYDNNMKYLQQYLRSNELNNTFEPSASSSTIQNIDIDLNLFNRMSTTQQNKPTSKIFDELKENVYQEVSALIAANETRPHFLIQLFRELQLISSDPLRQRALQSIQDLYNRYLDSNNYNAPSSGNNIMEDEILNEKCIPEESQLNQQNTVGSSSNFDHLHDMPNENREIPREPE